MTPKATKRTKAAEDPDSPSRFCLGNARRNSLLALFSSLPSVLVLFILQFAPAPLFAAEPTAPATPRRGGTLHLWFPNDFSSLDPAINYGTGISLVRLQFRGLLDYDDQGQIIADQAQDWNVSPDGKTYTFHLKPGIKFAHGRDVEAEDYVFTLERILNPKTRSSGESFYRDILGAQEFVGGKTPRVTGLRAPDSTTFVVELTQPAYTFRNAMAMTFAAVVPRELVQKYGDDFRSNLTGSGAYRVREWQRGAHWQFERNRHYQGTDAWVDGVDILIGGDSAMATMMLERGELEFVGADSVQAVQFRRTPDRSAWLQPDKGMNTSYVFLNTELKPFDDARVRRAMNHAVNRQRILQIAGGFGTVAEGIVPPSMPWSNPDRPHFDYDPGKARALLHEAGYPKGFKTQFWYEAQSPGTERVALVLQENFRNIGVTVELRGVSMLAFAEKSTTRGQVPCGLSSWSQDYPDPSNWLDGPYSSDRITESGSLNHTFYNEPVVDRLLATANRSLDGAERLRVYRSAETRILQDTPCIPLIHPRFLGLRHPRLHGGSPDSVWGWRYENMWLEN